MSNNLAKIALLGMLSLGGAGCIRTDGYVDRLRIEHSQETSNLIKFYNSEKGKLLRERGIFNIGNDLYFDATNKNNFYRYVIGQYNISDENAKKMLDDGLHIVHIDKKTGDVLDVIVKDKESGIVSAFKWKTYLEQKGLEEE